jgi:hypothetical protein
VYQIPVVVHVIHDGQPIGTYPNISKAQIQSQIDVLNVDFRRIFGTSGHNTHPSGADTEIEFCLAQRRPDGSAFPVGDEGVNRINSSIITGLTSQPGPYSQSEIENIIKAYT